MIPPNYVDQPCLRGRFNLVTLVTPGTLNNQIPHHIPIFGTSLSKRNKKSHMLTRITLMQSVCAHSNLLTKILKHTWNTEAHSMKLKRAECTKRWIIWSENIGGGVVIDPLARYQPQIVLLWPHLWWLLTSNRNESCRKRCVASSHNSSRWNVIYQPGPWPTFLTDCCCKHSLMCIICIKPQLKERKRAQTKAKTTVPSYFRKLLYHIKTSLWEAFF